MTTARLRDLLDGVVAAREDDLPRRVYADALLEAGEPQGELIHLQCERARGGLTRDEAIVRRRREDELLAAHADRWTAGLRGLAHDYRFARGFVDEVVITGSAWTARGGELFEAAPAIRAVTLSGLCYDGQNGQDSFGELGASVLDEFQRAVASPHLRRLSGLGHHAVGHTGRNTPWDSFDSASLDAPAMTALLAADTAHMRALAIHADEPDGALALAGSPLAPHLESLAAHALRDPGRLLDALDPARVRSLTVDDWHPALARFSELRDLAIYESRTVAHDLPPTLSRLSYRTGDTGFLTADHVAAIATAPELVGLVELELIAYQIPGWRALEHARFTDLRVLRLLGRDITIEQARELRRWPIADHLEVLELLDTSEADRAELAALFGCVVRVPRVQMPMVYSR